MGKDKAFLKLGQDRFVYRIARELLRVSDDLMVVIGRKEPNQFLGSFDDLRLEGNNLSNVRILNDQFEFENPLAGVLTGFANAKNDYAAVVACDMPLINSAVVKSLGRYAEKFDCAVPIWEDYNIEPLCGVYKVKASVEAATLAIQDGKVGPKHMVSYIPRVNYVPVTLLQLLDPRLDSLRNINNPIEYEELVLYLAQQREVASSQMSLQVRQREDT